MGEINKKNQNPDIQNMAPILQLSTSDACTSLHNNIYLDHTCI